MVSCYNTSLDTILLFPYIVHTFHDIYIPPISYCTQL
jgi:hypothetical protein